MVHQARDLSPEQRAAAELLLGRPLYGNESISAQAFEPMAPGEAEEVFTEAMRSSRPGYRTCQ